VVALDAPKQIEAVLSEGLPPDASGAAAIERIRSLNRPSPSIASTGASSVSVSGSTALIRVRDTHLDEVPPLRTRCRRIKLCRHRRKPLGGTLAYFPTMDVLRQALPMILSFLKMALVICPPLLLLAGMYDLKAPMTISYVQFALFFVDFWLQLAR